jgi:hypothetical protein
MQIPDMREFSLEKVVHMQNRSRLAVSKQYGRMTGTHWPTISSPGMPSPFVAYFALRSMGMKQVDAAALGESSYTGVVQLAD